jgi:hypothetical protein
MIREYKAVLSPTVLSLCVVIEIDGRKVKII